MGPRALVLSFLFASGTASCGLFPDLSSYGECEHGCPAATGTGGTGAGSGTTMATGAMTTGVSTTGTLSTGAETSTGAGACALTGEMAGPQGVLIDAPGVTPFCIDSTEVSVGDYRGFLVLVNTQAFDSFVFPDKCDWKQTAFEADALEAFTPRDDGVAPPAEHYLWTDYDDMTLDAKPVEGVDWCDAAVYCKFAGKRLCRADDHVSTNDDPNQGEWFRACSGEAGTQQWGAQGNLDDDQTLCNTADLSGSEFCDAYPSACMGTRQVTFVTEPTTCFSPWPDGKVYDLTGNVREWEDNCVGTGQPDDLCSPRGGAKGFGPDASHCNTINQGGGVTTEPRGSAGVLLGFRCCWDQ